MLEDQFDAAFRPIPLPDYQEQDPVQMQASAKQFYNFARRRHTVREFSPRPVPSGLNETKESVLGFLMTSSCAIVYHAYRNIIHGYRHRSTTA